MNTENAISKAKNYLLLIAETPDASADLRYLVDNFCGTALSSSAEIPENQKNIKVYACGDFADFELKSAYTLHIIRELSRNYEQCQKEGAAVIDLGAVPIVVCGAGVYFRALFEEEDIFHRIKAVHEFQELKESTKPSSSHRKGIYLTKVEKELDAKGQEKLHFRLLRCSSNLSGATDNLRDIDQKIIARISEAARYTFEQEADLNHVLAQIYENKKREDAEGKEAKARIKAHSDKTKDMPANALLAFCTFYDGSNREQLQASTKDKYDLCYKGVSGLTKLHFRLKNTVKDESLAKEFSVTLYPNSVFFIPLSTNRLYTHEIRPSMLNIDKIPTRLGYVVRCSYAEAVFFDGKTYLKEGSELVPLAPMQQESLSSLRSTYYEENATENRVQYGRVHFSMNAGDYEKPIY